MDKKQTALLLKQIDLLYPGRLKLEPITVETWHMVLDDQEYEQTMKRLKQYARESKFPPSAADLYTKESEPYRSNVLDQIKEWEKNAARKQ